MARKKSARKEAGMTATIAAATAAIAEAASQGQHRQRPQFFLDDPYRHAFVEDLLPAEVCRALAALPFAAPVLNGLSGKRELHNETRRYFDAGGVAHAQFSR